jgi:phage terminase large subunit GpA-like protein
MTVSQWADDERFLSAEASAEPGRWHTDRVPYLRDVMDAISDSQVRKVVVAKAAQVAYTEGIGLNTVGFYIAQDPCPILTILPTVELAESWSKDRLLPMLRDTPALANKVHEGRDGSNTIRNKIFPGGRLTLIGANAPAGLSARPIRIVIGDEIDRWPVNSGGSATGRGEGDPLALAGKRQITFWNRKTLIGSTPVNRETSVIWREFEASDKRFFHVPCPDCGEAQVLKWPQVRWEKDEKGNHMAETANYVCEHCGAIWDEARRQEAIKQGFWVASKLAKGVAGFHISGFMSPWLTLPEIVSEFLEARHDPQLLQVWVNTVLGEPWEGATEKVQPETIANRGENYGPQSIPDGVRFLTCGVDIQKDRIELQVVGWGEHDETWVVDYIVIRGDPNMADTWEEVDDALGMSYFTETHRELRIRVTCVDSGGNATASVLKYCAPRWRQRIFAIKGREGSQPIWPRRTSKTKRGNYDFFSVGVDTAKDLLYGRLKVTKPGPGFVHFPKGEQFGKIYFDQLVSERVEIRKHEGRAYRVWVLPSGRSNEALDCFVYAMAARYSMRIRHGQQPQAVAQPPAEVLPETGVIASEEVPAPAQEQAAAMRHSQWTTESSSWIGARRGWMSRK